MLVVVTVRKLKVQVTGVLRKPLPDLIWLLGRTIGPLTADVSLCLVIVCVRLTALWVVLVIVGEYCKEQVLRIKRLALVWRSVITGELASNCWTPVVDRVRLGRGCRVRSRLEQIPLAFSRVLMSTVAIRLDTCRRSSRLESVRTSTFNTLLALPTSVRFLPLRSINGATLVSVSVLVVDLMFAEDWIYFLFTVVRVMRDSGVRLLSYFRELQVRIAGMTLVPSTVRNAAIMIG